MEDAFEAMVESMRTKLGDAVEIWGVLIQKMLGKGKELIHGVIRAAAGPSQPMLVLS